MRKSLFCLFGLSLCFAGCSDNSLPRQKTYSAAGKVLLDGKPAPGLTVVFHPVDKAKFKWQERPQGVTNAKGEFSLTTYATGDGAPAGEYAVGIAFLGGAEGEEDSGSDQQKRVKGARLPAKYASHESSGLKATVSSSATTLPPFELSSK